MGRETWRNQGSLKEVGKKGRFFIESKPAMGKPRDGDRQERLGKIFSAVASIDFASTGSWVWKLRPEAWFDQRMNPGLTPVDLAVFQEQGCLAISRFQKKHKGFEVGVIVGFG